MELVWAAGLFEGEGSVFITAARRSAAGVSYVLAADLQMTDRACVEAYAAAVGRTVKRAGVTVTGKVVWRCAASGPGAVAVLQALYPYLRGSRSRAKVELASEFQAQKVAGGQGLSTQAYRHQQLLYRDRMRAL